MYAAELRVVLPPDTLVGSQVKKTEIHLWMCRLFEPRWTENILGEHFLPDAFTLTSPAPEDDCQWRLFMHSGGTTADLVSIY